MSCRRLPRLRQCCSSADHITHECQWWCSCKVASLLQLSDVTLQQQSYECEHKFSPNAPCKSACERCLRLATSLSVHVSANTTHALPKLRRCRLVTFLMKGIDCHCHELSSVTKMTVRQLQQPDSTPKNVPQFVPGCTPGG